MENYYFSDLSMYCIAISSIAMILLPVLVFIVWKVKTHSPVKPVIIGAVTFFLFAIVLKLPLAYLLYQDNNSAAQQISSNPWLYYLVGGLLAGVFEESGRFIAFKTLLKINKKKNTAISYAIGHGGFESMYIGFSMFSILSVAIMINSGHISELTSGLSTDQIALFEDQLSQYSSITVITALLSVLERCCAMIFHTAMSIFVFRAVNDKKKLWLYPTAILCHAAFDFIIVFTKFGLPLTALELIFVFYSLAMLIIAYRHVYKSYNTESADIKK